MDLGDKRTHEIFISAQEIAEDLARELNGDSGEGSFHGVSDVPAEKNGAGKAAEPEKVQGRPSQADHVVGEPVRQRCAYKKTGRRSFTPPKSQHTQCILAKRVANQHSPDSAQLQYQMVNQSNDASDAPAMVLEQPGL